jgi:lysophospholipase L1-like esterase
MHRLTLLLLAVTLTASAQLPNPELMRYACKPADRSFTTLSAASLYTPTRAGFDLDTLPDFNGKSCSSDKPFFVSVPIPEGSYRVTVILGGEQHSTTTVRAEARRLMLEKISTKPNASATHSFDVNVRSPEIAGNPKHVVKLKPREVGNLDWDNKLTLEFNGDHPSFRSITVEPVIEPTVYLAGDSTVVDQDVEPWTAWGQILPVFFRPGVVVANHAESGETIKSFVAEQRFDKIMSLIKPGDYLFIQFGHNDQKPNAVSIEEYKHLLSEFVAQTRAKGAMPVLITSVNRRTFDADGKITNSLAGYPDAVREVAATKHTALIDLNAMSKTLFEAMGPDVSMKAFMHYPANAYPNQAEPISDDTHFNAYGAYELARCILNGIHEAHLPLEKFIVKNVREFDPTHPDSQTDFNLPATPIPPKTTNVMKIPQV